MRCFTPLRRRSWTMRPEAPIAVQAVRHALRKSPIGWPARWKMKGQSSRRLVCRRSRITASSPTGSTRGSASRDSQHEWRLLPAACARAAAGQAGRYAARVTGCTIHNIGSCLDFASKEMIPIRCANALWPTKRNPRVAASRAPIYFAAAWIVMADTRIAGYGCPPARNMKGPECAVFFV